MAEAQKEGGFMLGIDDSVKSKNLVPFQPTDQNPLTLGYLTEVKSEKRVIESTGKEKHVLVFVFTDKAKIRTHIHTEWELFPDEEKGDAMATKVGGLQQRIKHIYEEFTPFPKEGITGVKTFAEFFDKVAKAFNTNGKDGKPIYDNVLVWMKVVYALKMGDKATLSFPFGPNFIERYKEGVAPTLYVNKKYETLEQPKGRAKGGVPMPDSMASVATGAFPEFKDPS